jgi:hypothetical protein
MRPALPYCHDCRRTYQRFEAHLQTQKHRRAAVEQAVECEICLLDQPRTVFVKCGQCVHTWCTSCNTKVNKCPFCRIPTTLPSISALLQRRRVQRRVQLVLGQLHRFRQRHTMVLDALQQRTVMVRMTWEEVRVLTERFAHRQ